MKYPSQNVGNTDKIIRLTVGIIFILIALLIPLNLWKWVFGVLGGILVLTSIMKYCVIYTLFKFNTIKNNKDKREN